MKKLKFCTVTFLDTACDTHIAGTKYQKTKKSHHLITRYAELNFLIPRDHLHGRVLRPKAFGRAGAPRDPKRSAEPARHETQSVWQRWFATRPKAFGRAGLSIIHFGMGVLHCCWFDFMAINCLLCFKEADVSFTSVWAEKTFARRRLETLCARNYLARLGVCSEKLSARQCLTSKDCAE